MIFGLALLMCASRYLTDRNRMGHSRRLDRLVVRHLRVRPVLDQPVTARFPAVASVRVGVCVDREETKASASITMEIPFALLFELIGTRVGTVLIRHQRPKSSHPVLFLGHLFTAVAQTCLGVEAEPAASIRSRNSHLLARKKRGAVREIAEREWAWTTREPRMKCDLDSDWLSILSSNGCREHKPASKVKHVAGRFSVEVWTTRYVAPMSQLALIHGHSFDPF